ncbi:hypothetical protein HY489_03635 [Candidatus Woesearchaeota archaeon]|nr:hypothetical protein [Candidatus Woesearchaeota archaeon]
MKPTLFFIICALTILLIRIGVFLIPEKDLAIAGIIVHHFWIGIVLILLSAFLRNILIFPIGLGLATDQLIFIIMGAGKDAQYWSTPSIIGAIFGLIMIFLFRKELHRISTYSQSQK